MLTWHDTQVLFPDDVELVAVYPRLHRHSRKVPGAHAVQSAPPLPVKPAVHMQSLMLVAPISEDEPTGQIEHATGPGAALNVPAPHCMHTPPFAPVYPALHSHVLLPAGESEFRGHA